MFAAKMPISSPLRLPLLCHTLSATLRYAAAAAMPLRHCYASAMLLPLSHAMMLLPRAQRVYHDMIRLRC